MALPVDRAAIVQLFEGIQLAFRGLTMVLDLEPRNVDLELVIPRQPGLSFKVALNLQGDELHLNAGEHFWVEWFPCTDADVVADYRDAVVGLLSGTYRLVEYPDYGKPYLVRLQRPEPDGWKTISSWGTLRGLFSRARGGRVLQNISSQPERGP